MNALIKKPSAWLPLVMSLAALSLILGYIALFGIPEEPATDEGTAAHIFQLLMGGQGLIVIFFVAKWLPQKPRETLQIFALQILAALSAFALLFFFES